MAPRIRHGVMRVGEAFPRHDVNQPAQPVWPRVRVAPRAKSDSRQLPAWVGWLAYGALALLVLQFVAIFLPLTWGWQWHNLGCDGKSWSMAAPGGVMPLSQYWIAKSPVYQPGDIVSLDYKDGGCADNNGASIKLVDGTASGKVHVHGLNKANSMLPCWVAVSDINGKIVAGPISLLPTAFWRWATMGWTLGQEDVVRRIRGLEMFPLRIFTERGRTQNVASLRAVPNSTLIGAGGYWTSASSETVPFNERHFGIYHLRDKLTEVKGKPLAWSGTILRLLRFLPNEGGFEECEWSAANGLRTIEKLQYVNTSFSCGQVSKALTLGGIENSVPFAIKARMPATEDPLAPMQNRHWSLGSAKGAFWELDFPAPTRCTVSLALRTGPLAVGLSVKKNGIWLPARESQVLKQDYAIWSVSGVMEGLRIVSGMAVSTPSDDLYYVAVSAH